MDELSVSKARIPTDTFNKVVYKGERVRIKHRCGKTVVLISEEDLQLLEELEDRLDAEAANIGADVQGVCQRGEENDSIEQPCWIMAAYIARKPVARNSPHPPAQFLNRAHQRI